jgi:hypothetical protein
VVVAAFVVLAIIAALVVRTLGAGADANRIRLLPVAGAKAAAWDWTATCSLAPSALRSCRASGPDLGAAQLDGDEWNLGGGAATPGSVRMSLSTGGRLVVDGDLPSSPPCTQPSCLAPSANTWVRGYPSVSYGITQCHPDASPPASTKLLLPARVSTIRPDLIGTTTYGANASQVTYDVAYDMWLSPSATKTPCHTDGTVEVMVWTDYDARALLPPSMSVGTATVPFSVDGAASLGTDAWTIYASNIFRAGQTVPWGGTVWLVLDAADAVSAGTVSVDLSAVFSAVGTLLEHNYGWSDFGQGYWLDTIPFGIEFGPESGTLTGSGPSYFSLNMSAYCLNVAATVAKAAC